jgi:hypothetical protein
MLNSEPPALVAVQSLNATAATCLGGLITHHADHRIEGGNTHMAE